MSHARSSRTMTTAVKATPASSTPVEAPNATARPVGSG